MTETRAQMLSFPLTYWVFYLLVHDGNSFLGLETPGWQVSTIIVGTCLWLRLHLLDLSDLIGLPCIFFDRLLLSPGTPRLTLLRLQL
jgi:hypothetical protein